MSCFITGATGLLGRYLERELLARGADGSIFVLVRGASHAKLEQLKQWWGAGSESVIPIDGDLGAPALGVAAADRTWLRGRVTHFFHLAALYDIEASTEALQQANRKFTARFEGLERLARERGVVLGEASLEELDRLWDEVKRSSR